MEYHLSKTVNFPFNEAVEKVKNMLGSEGFGIITQVDLKEKFKEKLQVDFREYTILGACNPKLALEAVGYDENIGLMLPCNVLVQQLANGDVRVSAINPLHSIGALANPHMDNLAAEVQKKLQAVIDKL
jgi:uncharacterized protein (DUF302 family)